jgi:hypothetical protein
VNVVIMDCCHSGTNTRAFLPPDAPSIPRYLPNPWDLGRPSPTRPPGTVATQLRSSSRAARRKSDVVNANIAGPDHRLSRHPDVRRRLYR